MPRYKKYLLEILKVSESVYDLPMTSPKTIHEYMKEEAKADREIFWILHLNNKNKIIKKEMTAMGATDHCVIVPGIILRSAVALGTPCIITVHNHPSGDTAPSDEDKRLWRNMKEGCNLLGIRILDNLIIGNNSYYSETEHK